MTQLCFYDWFHKKMMRLGIFLGFKKEEDDRYYQARDKPELLFKEKELRKLAQHEISTERLVNHLSPGQFDPTNEAKNYVNDYIKQEEESELEKEMIELLNQYNGQGNSRFSKPKQNANTNPTFVRRDT